MRSLQLNGMAARRVPRVTVDRKRRQDSGADREIHSPLVARQNLAVARCTHGRDHIEDALPNASLTNLVVSPHQLQRLALDKGMIVLFERCAGLPAIKCPRSIDFEAELPRHPTGKLYKRLLRDRYWQGRDSKIV